MGLEGERSVAAAIAASPMRTLPAATVGKMVANAVLLDLPRGSLPSRQGDDEVMPGLLVAGLLRAFYTRPDGRQLTVRYARPGGFVAIPTLYLKSPAGLGQQAVTPCRLLRFDAAALRQLAARDAQVANLFAEEATRRLMAYLDELMGNTFGSMRQRVIRHLMDLAASDERGDARLVARVSQQSLADAVGSVREVVVRVLRELREESLIKTTRDAIELLEPDRLSTEMYNPDS